MIKILDKTTCCGCGACEVSCPRNAITMVPDEAGFLFPQVNTTACVDCGLCQARCPMLHHEKGYEEKHEVFAAYAMDAKKRFCGSSGGMFGLFAEQTLKKNGIVYGAAFDENLHLCCTEAETTEQLTPLCKSKYLQSETAPIFSSVKEKLEAGRQVLFVSTPCQVKALHLFLGREYPNLLTVDFLCHGVPSQSFFDKCREYEEKKYGIKIINFQFRAKKKHGATPHYFTVTYEKKGKIRTTTKLYTQSTFYYGFQKYITLRDSCYECRFSGSNRCSDITIGDFHGIGKYVSGINRFDGISTVCLNTEKGVIFWNEISSETASYPMDFKQLHADGELMACGTKKPKNRDSFLMALMTDPFDKVVETHLNGRREYGKRLYYRLPRAIRKIIRILTRMKP